MEKDNDKKVEGGALLHREAVTGSKKVGDVRTLSVTYYVEFEATWPFYLEIGIGPNGVPYPVLVDGKGRRDIAPWEILSVVRYDLN